VFEAALKNPDALAKHLDPSRATRPSRPSWTRSTPADSPGGASASERPRENDRGASSSCEPLAPG
jgi:hypothetical protein